MFEDKIREAFSSVLDARSYVVAWRVEEKSRMKAVKHLLQAENKMTAGFDAAAFLKELEAQAKTDQVESEEETRPTPLVSEEA